MYAGPEWPLILTADWNKLEAIQNTHPNNDLLPWFVQNSTIARSIQLQNIQQAIIQDSKTIFTKLSKSGHDNLWKIGQPSAPDETKTSWTDPTYLETTLHFMNTYLLLWVWGLKPRNSEKGCKYPSNYPWRTTSTLTLLLNYTTKNYKTQKWRRSEPSIEDTTRLHSKVCRNTAFIIFPEKLTIRLRITIGR